MHDELTDEITERAALYAADALDEGERRAFEEHLRAGCAVCESEARSFLDVATALPQAAPAVRAPRRLRGALLERVGAGAGAGASSEAAAADPDDEPESYEAHGVRFVRAADGDFVPVGIPGIWIKHLCDNPDGTVTMLARMAPGARYPAHRHVSTEQVYVLEGDLHVGDVTLEAGDFQFAHTGSDHDPHWTEKGCMILLVGSMYPEFH